MLTQSSLGRKFRSTAGIPPMWSLCAWLKASTSRRRNLRDQRYGDTTSSPTSKRLVASAASVTPPTGPPASSNMVDPSGLTMKMESPWPTSIAVTSIMPGETMAGSGHNTISGTRDNTTTAAHAQPRDLRTAQQQKAQVTIASSAIHHTGAGTRRSAARTALTWPMTPLTPCSIRAVTAPGSIATQGLTSDAQNVITAIGASTATKGTLNILVGTANIVARWK